MTYPFLSSLFIFGTVSTNGILIICTLKYLQGYRQNNGNMSHLSHGQLTGPPVIMLNKEMGRGSSPSSPCDFSLFKINKLLSTSFIVSNGLTIHAQEHPQPVQKGFIFAKKLMAPFVGGHAKGICSNLYPYSLFLKFAIRYLIGLKRQEFGIQSLAKPYLAYTE